MLSKQPAAVNEAIAVFDGNNENVCFLDESAKLASPDDNMASRAQERDEGEAATEQNQERMTIFEPYRSGVVGLSIYSRRDVNAQQRRQQPDRNKPRGARVQPEQTSTGISAAKDLFRRIRSSLSLPQSPPTSSTLSATSGARATRKHPDKPTSKQVRPPTNPPAKAVSHAPSAPQLNKASGGTTRVQKPSPISATAAPQYSRRSESRETSPSVIKDMASFGPGSGRRHRPPAALIVTPDRDRRSKSEEPSPTSTRRDKLFKPGPFDDDSKVLSSASSETHIRLVSYSDAQRHRVAKAGAASAGGAGEARGAGGGGVGSTPNTAVILPPRGKQQLNKQDVLKRIGSIGSDEVRKSHCRRVHVHA